MSKKHTLRELELEKKISDLEDQNKALMESEKRYRSVFENAGTVIMLIENDMTISMINKKIKDFAGYSPEEIEGRMKWTEFVADKDQLEKMKFYHKQRRLENSNIPKEYEFKFLRKDGSETGVILSIDIVPGQDQSIAALVDNTSFLDAEKKQKRLYAQASQSRKMESIGLLAGGIAHDFNNILAAIMGYIEMSRAYAAEDSSIPRWLDSALISCKKAKELVAQMLTFSCQHKQSKQPITPSAIIKKTVTILQETFPVNINIETMIDENCGNIMGDPAQFQQILVNICSNSTHAMPENKGAIKIQLDSIKAENEKDFSLNLAPGKYAKLTISDTGHGMEQEVVDRIFEPFFTTKKQGEGAGMGLAITHGLIKSFNGKVFVESEAGKGTVFRLYFPDITEANGKPTGQKSGDTDCGNKILIVDDDKELLEMSKEIIESLGYHVVSCSDSLEAGKIFNADPNDFGLVISDQKMPGMTGIELAKYLIKKRPDIPVVLCTGDRINENSKLVDETPVAAFLNKPVKINQFAEVIENLIEKKIKKD